MGELVIRKNLTASWIFGFQIVLGTQTVTSKWFFWAVDLKRANAFFIQNSSFPQVTGSQLSLLVRIGRASPASTQLVLVTEGSQWWNFQLYFVCLATEGGMDCLLTIWTLSGTWDMRNGDASHLTAQNLTEAKLGSADWGKNLSRTRILFYCGWT